MGVNANPRGSPRRRKTPRSVYLADHAANSVIRLGGVAVIAAVLGICFYLAAVVVPLFLPGTSELADTGESRSAGAVAVLPDEYGGSAAVVSADGRIDVVELSSGALLGTADRPKAVSTVVTTPQGLVAWGYHDGSFQLGEVTSRASVLSSAQAAALGDANRVAQSGPFDGLRSVAESGSQRVTTFGIETRAAVEPRTETGPVELLDYRRVGGGRELLFTAWADGSAMLSTVRVTTPLDGSEPRLRLTGRAVELDAARGAWAVAFADGESVLTIARDGTGVRYGLPADAGRRDPLIAMERLDLAGGAGISAVTALPGGRSLVAGGDDGSLWVWTLSRDPLADAGDGRRLVKVEKLRAGDSAVVALTAGQRDRTITAATATGRISQLHLTSGKLIDSYDASAIGIGEPVAVGMAPRQDGVVAIGAGGAYAHWSVDPRYPGAGWRALFGRIVYEGETEAKWVYQSSSAEDASEVKMSLVPLIFGTFKATIVAMFIAAPLSVLAAIYSSEFLHKRVRSTVKPAIELMASLPSVVLGFIAMAAVAPWVGDHLSGVMIGMLLVPAVVLLAAHVWQLLPTRVLLGVPTWARITLVGLVMIAAGGVSLVAGGPAERAFFGPTRSDQLLAAGSFEAGEPGDIPSWVGTRATMAPDTERRLRTEGFAFRDGVVVRAVEPELGSPEAAALAELVAADSASQDLLRGWLDGQHGRPWPGWVLLLIPLAAPCSWWLAAKVRRSIAADDRGRLATGAAELVLFAGSLAVAVGLAVAGSLALQAVGFDPRDSFLGTFSQRNTLVVGMVMGFAIIPIIYTISEDALSAVPDTLRSASLGAGATPWQTAWRVVLPVATSGVFSACMIGLGRAAGETMIMLMATGNTPQMDLNLFSGFRTLAANIATELPEAERGGTHYRVLFLCGLVLFVVTFIINTLAEVVRQRFRKKSASL